MSFPFGPTMLTTVGTPPTVSDRVLASARAVAQSLAVPADWPATCRAIPVRRWRPVRLVPVLREADWPVVELPALADAQHGFVATRPTAVVPESWLRELARLLEVPFGELCCGTVGSAPRG
jgi:hypothetical protein